MRSGDRESMGRSGLLPLQEKKACSSLLKHMWEKKVFRSKLSVRVCPGSPSATG